jgi:thiamine pyrophosphate-dependent acetolactate synthase large subunit-like protein
VLVYEALAEEIGALGTRACFGLMAEESMHLIGHLTRETGVAYYGARHEATAVAMADGYAWSSGNLGICILSRGPGYVNGLTAAISAVK